MDNKKRKTNCLNCKHSHRDNNGVLRCHKGKSTSVSNYDCIGYEVFMENKEDLARMYEVVKELTSSKTSHTGSEH